MSRTDLFKLLTLALFGSVVFLAGFFLGSSLQRQAWQADAINHRLARWVRNQETGRWDFEWRSPGDFSKNMPSAPPPPAANEEE